MSEYEEIIDELREIEEKFGRIKGIQLYYGDTIGGKLRQSDVSILHFLSSMFHLFLISIQKHGIEDKSFE